MFAPSQVLKPSEIASDPVLLEQVQNGIRFAIEYHDAPPCHGRFSSDSSICRGCESRHYCAVAQGNPRVIVRVHLDKVEFGLKLLNWSIGMH